jgi:hypothetical protein
VTAGVPGQHAADRLPLLSESDTTALREVTTVLRQAVEVGAAGRGQIPPGDASQAFP